MCTLLAKLAIGLSATMATGFYYLAAAPPASAVDVCGPGNFSSACAPDRSASPQSPAASPIEFPPDPIPSVPLVVESPLAPPEPIPSVPVVPSPPPIVEPAEPPLVIPTPDPEPIPSPPVEPPPVIPNPITTPSPAPIPSPFSNIYINPTVRTTAIPEPGTVVALLLVGAGIIYSGRKRNKQVGQQR